MNSSAAVDVRRVFPCEESYSQSKASWDEPRVTTESRAKGSPYSSMTGMLYSSRRSFLAKLSAVALAARTRSWANEPGDLLFAASYAKEKDGTNGGIHAFRWDADDGTLASLGLAVSTPQPGFLALSPDHRHLYAVNHVDDYHGENSGSVTSFAVEGSSGRLRRMNTVSSAGASPAKIAVDLTGQAAFVANYGGGSASSYRLLRSGALSQPVCRLQYKGHGANPERQAVPHAHCTTVSPDNRFLLVNDLGLDRISVYHLDPRTAKLTPNDPPFYEALPGSGPRSFAFHPSGKWAYSLNEIANTIDALGWDSERGILSRLQNISTLPSGYSGSNTAATVVVDSSGRFLYASNRGDNSVAVFSINDRKGTLKAIQHVASGGKTPRHFALDPGNQWLLVANQDSSNLVVFARNLRTGMLTPTGREYALGQPVCLAFALMGH
jgi:6-phosphogluconolactonase